MSLFQGCGWLVLDRVPNNNGDSSRDRGTVECRAKCVNEMCVEAVPNNLRVFLSLLLDLDVAHKKADSIKNKNNWLCKAPTLVYRI